MNFALIAPPNQVYRTKVPYSKISYVQHNTNCCAEELNVGGLAEAVPIGCCGGLGEKDKAKSIYEALMFKATPDSPGKALLSMSRM